MTILSTEQAEHLADQSEEIPDSVQAGMGYMLGIIDNVEDCYPLTFWQRVLLALARLFAHIEG